MRRIRTRHCARSPVRQSLLKPLRVYGDATPGLPAMRPLLGVGYKFESDAGEVNGNDLILGNPSIVKIDTITNML